MGNISPARIWTKRFWPQRRKFKATRRHVSHATYPDSIKNWSFKPTKNWDWQERQLAEMGAHGTSIITKWVHKPTKTDSFPVISQCWKNIFPILRCFRQVSKATSMPLKEAPSTCLERWHWCNSMTAMHLNAENVREAVEAQSHSQKLVCNHMSVVNGILNAHPSPWY